MELGNRTANCTDLERVLYETESSCIENCTELENCTESKTELSSKKSKINKSDIIHNTKSISSSTGNAPNQSNTHCYLTEEVYANSIKIPQSRNLTPETIMVVDTIGTIKSRRLLKVLLDSGSTATLINKRCLPRKCEPCKTSQNRMVNTLAGSYQSSAMVVMRNLRLPELDKHRDIEQHKALIFESDNCKYDVILGADFLTA